MWPFQAGIDWSLETAGLRGQNTKSAVLCPMYGKMSDFSLEVLSSLETIRANNIILIIKCFFVQPGIMNNKICDKCFQKYIFILYGRSWKWLHLKTLLCSWSETLAYVISTMDRRNKIRFLNLSTKKEENSIINIRNKIELLKIHISWIEINLYHENQKQNINMEIRNKIKFLSLCK